MNNYKIAFIVLFTTINTIGLNAQVNHDPNGNFDYIQNYVFPVNQDLLPYNVSTRFRIGSQVSNQTAQGKVIVPENASVTIQTFQPFFSEICIKPGFEIRPFAYFSFVNDIRVGNTLSSHIGNVALTYNLDNTGFLNLDPLIFSNPATKSQMWGVEIYNEGLNFWRPYSGGDVNYKLFITSAGGNVGIGKIPFYKLDVNGDIATSGSFITSSDKRLKSEIRPLIGCNIKLNLLNGKSYNKTTKSQNSFIKPNESKQMGLLAQEVMQIYPELVTQDSTGIYSIDYLGLLPIIIETIKEQKSRYENNHKKIDAIKQYINETYSLTL